VVKLDSDVILGEDRRLDIHELDPGVPGHDAVRRAASGVGMLVTHRNLFFDGSSKPRLHTRRETAVACKGESKFIGQPKYTGMAATAFLVNERHVVTAGHFVDCRHVDDLSVVFRYVAKTDWHNHLEGEAPPYDLEPSQLARVDRILYCSTAAATGDLAVLHLADAVNPATAIPLQLAKRQSLRNGPGFSMVGHPRGLPCKAVVGDGHRKEWPRVWSFDARSAQTNVDGLQKSSGSPLLDRFGRVVGVMSHRIDARTGNLEDASTLAENHCTSWCSRIDLIADLLAELGIPGI
jgi:hypothetical protein